MKLGDPNLGNIVNKGLSGVFTNMKCEEIMSGGLLDILDDVKYKENVKDKRYLPPPRKTLTEKTHEGRDVLHVSMGRKESTLSDEGRILYTDGVYNCKAIILIYLTIDGKLGASLQHVKPNASPSMYIPDGARLIQREWVDGPASDLRDGGSSFSNCQDFFSVGVETNLSRYRFSVINEVGYDDKIVPDIGCVGVTVDLDNRKIIILNSKIL